MLKNTASQKIALFAFDTTTSLPKTGDAANITAYVSKDFGAVTVLGDSSATEMDATNAKGWYLFDLTQAETNADALLFTGKSSTANISVVGQLIYTLPASFTSLVVGNLDATISSRSSHSAADVWAVATRLLTAGTNIVLAKGTGVTGFTDISAAAVNAEVVDALATDTYLEPGQGVPLATASLATKISFVYKALRNKVTQTATTYSLFNDDAVTVDQKATVSDDGTVFTRGEITSGP